ncbi:MAG: hypothetical protein K9K64_04775 [Desulfohalobiaceae bacterium]|nr:hypothetical protein [Desulfohalobiaceae bacterium]
MFAWFGRIKSSLKQYQSWRQKKKLLSAGSFRALCLEVRDIAELSAKLWSGDDWFQKRVAQINTEMEKLDSLLGRREFDRIPLQKKDELRRNLMRSREELLKRVHNAPCPTDRLQ